jgi:uncharacterized membrane protein
MTHKIVMLVLPSRDRLLEVHEKIETLAGFHVKHAGIIVKAADGETSLLDDDIKADEGVITGGTLGAIISALGVAGLGAFLLPGVGAILALGAGALFGGLIGGATGGIVAKLIDTGFNDAQIRELSSHIEVGKAAIIYEYEGGEDAPVRLQTLLSGLGVHVVLPHNAG